MKPLHVIFLLISLVSAALTSNAQVLRERLPLDNDWKFILGDTPGAATATFDDTSWRTVHLPHDWSIEGRTDPNAPAGGGGGFFPTGIGWYRHNFTAPTTCAGRRILVEFEGVATNAEVFLNNQSIGVHPNGFTSFFVDLSPHLLFGRENVLAVRVDNSQQPNTRYYTGSGLYRHVWLHITNPIHIAKRSIPHHDRVRHKYRDCQHPDHRPKQQQRTRHYFSSNSAHRPRRPPRPGHKRNHFSAQRIN